MSWLTNYFWQITKELEWVLLDLEPEFHSYEEENMPCLPIFHVYKTLYLVSISFRIDSFSLWLSEGRYLLPGFVSPSGFLFLSETGLSFLTPLWFASLLLLFLGWIPVAHKSQNSFLVMLEVCLQVQSMGRRTVSVCCRQFNACRQRIRHIPLSKQSRLFIWWWCCNKRSL